MSSGEKLMPSKCFLSVSPNKVQPLPLIGKRCFPYRKHRFFAYRLCANHSAAADQAVTAAAAAALFSAKYCTMSSRGTTPTNMSRSSTIGITAPHSAARRS